ncbi:hypothetical protein [Tenacibaculum sp. M341]|uniref:hypothetical protein n=1 Tax=Tenacibaculum sp. M341 TaxID=2530339 RepID=UPI001042A2A8|nr:hypothetical protein [Tenacibaculum sp. M341]TCI84583.1 hypothetical protein EYW44_20675 [Tenacibaculum sp. M341]
MNRTLNLLFILIIILNFSCSNKKKDTRLNNVQTIHKADSISDDSFSFNEFNKTEQILFERISDNEIWIYNCLYSGFTGETTLIKVNKKLEIKSAYYNYWTDVIDENSTEFKVVKSKIEFNENPFTTNKQININYELKINEISYKTQKIVNSKTITSKFISKEMAESEEKSYKKKYGFINSFDAYKIKYVDKKPKLLSGIETLKRKLNSDFDLNRIIILFTIDIKGKILKESIKLRVRKNLETEEKDKIKNLIIERLNYMPGYINEKPVNTEFYLKI